MARGKPIYDILEREHREVAKLLEQLCATGQKDLSKRKRLFTQIQEDLLEHSEAERQVFYRELKAHDDLKEYAFEGREEHSLVKKVLREMDRMDHANERWIVKARVLKELVEHHVEEEEQEMFPRARQAIGQERAVELGREFKAAKQKVEAA